MEPYYFDDDLTLYREDCLVVLPTLPDASVDAVVTDPPYGLEFMGQDWDRPWAVGMSAPGYSDAERLERPSFGDSRNANCRACGGRQRGTKRCGCSTPAWDRHPNEDMRAYQEWCQAWAAECLRVLKPGGHLLAFGGTRTAHRLTSGIEDAGFEIRDGIDWLYGSGFPKSLDVSKAIDKTRNDKGDWLKVTSWLADRADEAGVTRAEVDDRMGTSDMGGWWLSRLEHRCALPTLDQWDRLRDLIRFGQDMDAEVLRLNLRKGEPGEAWAGRPVAAHATRPGMAESWTGGAGWTGTTARAGSGILEEAKRWEGWGTALKPAREPIVVARKPLAGTVAANVLSYGTGALNIDASRIDGRERTDYGLATATRSRGATFGEPSASADFDSSKGRWPTNVVLSHAGNDVDGDLCADGCVPGCPVAELDRQSGVTSSGSRKAGTYGLMGHMGADPAPMPAIAGDSGGASRYFPVFRYEAKAPTAERPKVDGEAHATVKPLDLMRWLVQLVTPPGGTVLEPFAGSGTTVEACLAENFRCIAIEREPKYLPLIMSRITKPIEPTLFGVASEVA